MAKIAKKIKDLRLLLNLGQAELGKALGGIPQSTISKWENGKQEPDAENTLKLAALAGVEPHQWMGIPAIGEVVPQARRIPVVGAVQAGAWREAVAYPEDDQRWVEAPLPDEFGKYDIQAFDLVGPSMNMVYPDGTTIYVASTMTYGEPVSGDRVLVIRKDKSGLVEATLKEFVVGEDGRVWLWPRSTDPEFQAPLPYVEGSDGDDIVVSGIVVAALVLERSRRQRKKTK